MAADHHHLSELSLQGLDVKQPRKALVGIGDGQPHGRIHCHGHGRNAPGFGQGIQMIQNRQGPANGECGDENLPLFRDRLPNDPIQLRLNVIVAMGVIPRVYRWTPSTSNHFAGR